MIDIVFQKRFEHLFGRLIVRSFAVYDVLMEIIVQLYHQLVLADIVEAIQLKRVVFDAFFDKIIGFTFMKKRTFDVFKIAVFDISISRNKHFYDFERRGGYLLDCQMSVLYLLITE